MNDAILNSFLGHVFYHADRSGVLKENQDLALDSNKLSFFGKGYWDAINTKSVKEMSFAEKREYYLEQIKREDRYHLYASRMQSIFAANSIAEAIVFANSIMPRPGHPIPIIEIYAVKFWTLDSSWLDYINESNTLDNYRKYWDALITNHRPNTEERRPPRLEVMIALPARTGKVVEVVK